MRNFQSASIFIKILVAFILDKDFLQTPFGAAVNISKLQNYLGG